MFTYAKPFVIACNSAGVRVWVPKSVPSVPDAPLRGNRTPAEVVASAAP